MVSCSTPTHELIRKGKLLSITCQSYLRLEVFLFVFLVRVGVIGAVHSYEKKGVEYLLRKVKKKELGDKNKFTKVGYEKRTAQVCDPH